MSSNRWFRFYNEVLDDPKVQRLSPTLFRAWVNLLCLASANDGKLPCIDDIAFKLRVSVQDAQQHIDELILAGLLDPTTDGLVPHNWRARQFVSDSSTERVRKHRRNKAETQCNVSETANETPPDTDSESDTDSETEVSVSARQPLCITETEIAHRGFVISLPAIQLATIKLGLPKDEIKNRCLAHALQWAAEIDAGKLPRDVLPQKIANFLAASIMGEANRDNRTVHRANARPVSSRAEANRKAGEILQRMMADASAEEVLQ